MLQAVAAAVSVCGLPAPCSKSVVSEVAAAVGTWKLLYWFQRKLWWAGDYQLLGSRLYAGGHLLGCVQLECPRVTLG